LAVRKSTKRKSVKALAVKTKTIADEISEDWLRKHAREKAFARASSYADEDVIEVLHWCPKEIIAEMYGSQPYTVSLRFNKSKLSADCTCPARHDWPGLCKHIVGLGLFVIDSRYRAAEFPQLKNEIASALGKLPSTNLSSLCIDLAMLNRNFRDRILQELGISFESKMDWDGDY
jgi:hypothetical protein